jgi:glycosyltransferase involved in cell wall biosynthesis
LEIAISKVYEWTVGRVPQRNETDIWRDRITDGLEFEDFLLAMSSSAEGTTERNHDKLLPALSDTEFIQSAYEVILNRGCTAREISHWETQLAFGSMSRRTLILSLFINVTTTLNHQRRSVPNSDNHTFTILGTEKTVTMNDWKAKERNLCGVSIAKRDVRYHNRFFIKTQPHFLVSAIASLYKAGDFINQFLDNITSQTCFKDYCELIIIDAKSPDNEHDLIKQYLLQFNNIKYLRMNYRIGIYDAWNVGVECAKGDYLTNTNLDDLRREDSLELQAATLDNLSFVDIVYQDLYYSLDPGLSPRKVAMYGYETNLPIVTPHNLLEFNSPHNAPMWRAALHNELGYFDTTLRSAGDYEFWMRCVAAGKTFYKLNDPHVTYYQNPAGVSTRPDTPGISESKELLKRYARKLVSTNCVIPRTQFREQVLRDTISYTETQHQDRYLQTQTALRNSARRLKYKGVARK